MKALCWEGVGKVKVKNVPDPKIINRHDAIIKVTSTAICGSDLHLFDGYIPTMEQGDILGHEFMGEVMEIGREVKKLKVGDRVVVPFNIACGNCAPCQQGKWSLCDNSNPNAFLAEKLYGYSAGGLFGYSHLYGGYAGGQAEYVRVPFADVGPMVIPEGIDDEKVLFLTDVFPTGYQAAENGNIKSGDVVAVWGCGPVGQFAIKSAYMFGADRVIAIDRVQARLRMAEEEGKAETINYEETKDVIEALKQMTGGRGPDVCIDAVGLEMHGTSVMSKIDATKQHTGLGTDRPDVLRQAIQACGKGGTISIPGVYGGFLDKIPFGAAFAKGLTFRMGQTHTQKYLHPLLERIVKGEIDPSFIISHRLTLDDAPHGYQIFRDKQDSCTKVVLKP